MECTLKIIVQNTMKLFTYKNFQAGITEYFSKKKKINSEKLLNPLTLNNMIWLYPFIMCFTLLTK